jgi:hypothetical protein
VTSWEEKISVGIHSSGLPGGTHDTFAYHRGRFRSCSPPTFKITPDNRRDLIFATSINLQESVMEFAAM